MTSRERIMAVLTGQEPDRIPWVPLIGRYYVHSLKSLGIELEKIAPREKAQTPALQREVNMYEIETIKYVGADVLHRHVDAYTLSYKTCQTFAEENNGARRDGFITPLGTLTAEYKQGGGTEYVTKHLVETQKDLDILTYIMKDTVVEPFYQDFHEFDEYIGDDGITTLTGPLTPIQLMLQFYMGLTNVTYALMDQHDQMQELFEAIHRRNRQIYQVMAESPANVAITYEDTSTTVLSPVWYKKYCMKQLNEYAEILHSHEKIFIVHMCGQIQRLTKWIAPGKMDGIDSVCPPTTGDLEPGEALQQIGKIIIGGIEPPALVRMTAEETKAYTLEKLRQVGSGKNFMLSTGDSTAAGTPIENLRAVSEVIREYGAYPLDV